MPERQHQHGGSQGDIDEKDSTPGEVIDQPAAEDRTDRGRDRAEARPGADRLPALFLAEGGAELCGSRTVIGQHRRLVEVAVGAIAPLDAIKPRCEKIQT